jgi:hypothetical protein
MDTHVLNYTKGNQYMNREKLREKAIKRYLNGESTKEIYQSLGKGKTWFANSKSMSPKGSIILPIRLSEAMICISWMLSDPDI